MPHPYSPPAPADPLIGQADAPFAGDQASDAAPDTGLLRVGHNCWRIERAERFACIVDAADYFRAVRAAMLKARHQITLVAWDFDARIDMGGAEDGAPRRLGDFILWLARRTPGLEIRVLRWRTGALRAMFRGSTLWSILRWKAHPRITLRLDAAHALAGSHHQKIVVIDDAIAFCGGIDMTVHRWDTRAHPEHDAARTSPGGHSHPPWHDAACAVDGAAARALGDLARSRWQAATAEILAPCPPTQSPWPDTLVANGRGLQVGLSRTLPLLTDRPAVAEIEAAWVDMIASARRMIYIENQYLAARRIAHALALRLVEETPPEIVIVGPRTAHGWLEPLAMDSARAELVEALRKLDHKGRLRLYYPQTAQGTPIYVHAKVMVVDDRLLRIGSSNINNRSMRLDSECDVILDAYGEDAAPMRAEIARLRNDLLAEHLGIETATFAAHLAQSQSLIETIEALRGPGRSLVPYEVPVLSGIEQWLAENEILDPNGPEEIFESLTKRGLFKGWGKLATAARAARDKATQGPGAWRGGSRKP